MTNRRAPEPAVVSRLTRGLLVFELPDQLAPGFVERAREVWAICDRDQRRSAGQSRPQRDALFCATTVLQGDVDLDIVRIPPAQVRSQRRQCLHHVPAFLRREPCPYTYHARLKGIPLLVR